MKETNYDPVDKLEVIWILRELFLLHYSETRVFIAIYDATASSLLILSVFLSHLTPSVFLIARAVIGQYKDQNIVQL